MKKVALLYVLLALTSTWALADRVAHPPIVITSDDDFTYENGVVSGSGLPTDPYVIAGWKIDKPGAPFGILIQGTTLPFVIRDVEVCGAKMAGIEVVNARSGRIENCLVQGSVTGIMLFMGEGLRIQDSTIRECKDAVRILFSTGIEITDLTIAESLVGVWFTKTTGTNLTDSVIQGCQLGVKLELGSEGNLIARNAFLSCWIPAQSRGGNQWDDGSRGNYWEGFSAPDEDEDSILDRPYSLGFDKDRFPLVSPPSAE